MRTPEFHSDEPRRRSDGEATHAAIVEAAVRLASIEGLNSLTIGRLARELGISKSGVFAHFRSKERLQQETVDAAGETFERVVLARRHAAPEGLAQLETLCEAYLSYVERRVFPGGCFFAHLLAEFDAQPGAIHDQMEENQHGWLRMLAQMIETAIENGELNPETDPVQLAFELHASMELANYLSVLHRDPSVVDRGRRAIRGNLDRARSR